MGGLRRKTPTSSGTVAFPPREARCYHLLFGGTELQEWAWLDPSELADRVRAWLRGRANAQLGDLVPHLIDRGEAVTVSTMARPVGPALPPLLADQALDVATTERLAHATHVLRIEAANPPAPTVGFPGLWCAFAAAATTAAGAGAVWFDVGALRVRSTAATDDPLTGDGAVHMGDHLLLLQSRDGRGDLQTTTKGMAAFGLPELLVDGAPGHLGGVAALLVQGVAQRLVDALVDEQHASGTPRVDVPVEVVVTGAHVARAAEGALVRELGATRVRLTYRPADATSGDDHLVVAPGDDARRTGAEWLTQVAAELLTTRSTPMQTVDASAPALERAHARAVAELAQARRVAQAGRPGELVFVKRGFPTNAGSIEYLWVVVEAWDERGIRGRLANEPADAVGLVSGQTVQLDEADVFDWLQTRDGRRVAGGYSIDALHQ